MPDDVLPEIPTISAKGEGQHPRNADQVFGFEPFRRAPGLLVATTVVVRALGPDTALIVTAPAVCPPVGGVSVPNIDPQCSVIYQ